MVWAETVSGLLGGSAGIFVTHPLDTVRIRAQIIKKPTNYFNIAREIVKTKGFIGFYAGVTPPVALRGVGFAVNRTFYGAARKYTANPFILGCIAGFTQSVCECPVHLVKNRAQVGRDKVKESLSHYFRQFVQICKQERLRGLFSGFVAGSIFNTGSYGVFYLVYDKLRNEDVSIFIAGPAACFASWPLFYPFDVIRTRMQIVSKKTHWSKKYWTFTRVGKQMMLEGNKSWFAGLGLTLVRACPRFIVAMAVCEETKKTLECWE